LAEIGRARGKISETELQILQLDQDFRTDVLKDLRETEGKVAEFKERVTAAVDQLNRVDIRAPQDGFVNQLAVHTVGGLVGTGDTLMQIVPRADALVVEAKVAPQDIDQVAVASGPRLRRPHPRSGHAIGPTLLAVAGYDSKATTLWAAGGGAESACLCLARGRQIPLL
jgi:HlyD family secretion protein